MPSETEVKENIFLFVPNLIGKYKYSEKMNNNNNTNIYYDRTVLIRIPFESNDVYVVIT